MKTTSSLKHESRCIVGMRMMNANRSSMNVLRKRKMRNFHGRCATLLSR